MANQTNISAWAWWGGAAAPPFGWPADQPCRLDICAYVDWNYHNYSIALHAQPL